MEVLVIITKINNEHHKLDLVYGQYIDLDINFLDAWNEFNLKQENKISNDDEAIVFCKKFVPSFDPYSQAIRIGEIKGKDGFDYLFYQVWNTSVDKGKLLHGA